MIKLKLKNVGPVKNGVNSNDGFLDFKGVTVFIGNQGSGKSTIAKIFSTLSWIEKALVRGDFTGNYISQYNRIKKHLSYQGIDNYLNGHSLIEYIGHAFTIKYCNAHLTVNENGNRSNYKFPKIMYVPAERNFVSSVDRPDLIKRLPLPLYTFLEEYEEAKRGLAKGVKLPIGNVDFEYQKQNRKSWLIGKDFKIELLEASSGFQSIVPLLLVTKHLVKIIKNPDLISQTEVTIDEKNKIVAEINNFFNRNKNLSEDLKIKLLEKIYNKLNYSCFVNIVEEPEQNLYPTSQKEILFELLKSKNDIDDNRLVITTHSPYIINYLTLAIKAYNVKKIIQSSGKSEILMPSLSEVVPINSALNPSAVSIYQLNNNGEIDKLSDYNGLPSDENYLNNFLSESNDLFVKLLKIEDKCL